MTTLFHTWVTLISVWGLRMVIHYVWCVMQGSIANHQQTRVYTLFAIHSFQSTNVSCVFKKKCECEFFLRWCAKLPPRGEIARITSCVHKSKSTSMSEYFNSAHIRFFYSPFWKHPFSIFFWTCSGWVLKDESVVGPTRNPSP